MQRTNRLFYFLLVISLSLGACAFTKQEVQLQASPAASQSCAVNGNGRRFVLYVTDGRDDTTLGSRAPGTSGKITVAGDVLQQFTQSVANYYTACGFSLSPVADLNIPSVKVELRTLKYEAAMGFWTGKISVKGAAKVVVTKNNQEIFNNMERSDLEKNRMFVSGKKSNGDWISQVFNDLVKKIVEDPGVNSAIN